MSQAISAYLSFPSELQFEVLAAVQRNAFYVPRDSVALNAAQEHWNAVRGSGAASAFSMRIAPMPHEPAPVYTVDKDLAEYLKRLYVGGDIAPYGKMDFRRGASAELDAIIFQTVANDETVVTLDGVIKCEAMGWILRHDVGSMSNPVGMVDGSPFVGSVDFTLSDHLITHMRNDGGYKLKHFAEAHFDATSPAETLAQQQEAAQAS